MKKILLLLPIVAALAACGTTDPYGKRAENERDISVRTQERILDKTPDWFSKLPISNSAVYEAGYGSSFNLADADAYAKADAYGKVCMAAGGKTSQYTKMYSSEGESSRTQVNERATKSYCPNVDLTGIEQNQIKRFVTPNGKINTYVLVALPTGDANVLRKAKEAHAERELALKRAPEAFKELDKQ
jgi:outer membrane lipopolysaccharide assembly protein LptE/RlpB